MLTSCVTIEQLILALEEQEVLELSRLDDPLAPTVDEPKVQFALDRALGIINSYYITSSDCGKAYIKTMCQQLTIWITRFLLDTTKARPFVESEYDKAMELLKYACSECVADNCPLSDEEIEEILGTKPKTGKLRVNSGFDTKQRAIGRVYDFSINKARYNKDY